MTAVHRATRLRALAIAVGALAAVGLVGCTDLAAPVVSPTPSVAVRPDPTPTITVPPAGTVVATAQFTGRATGRASITSDGDGDYTVHLDHLNAHLTSNSRLALGATPGVFNCEVVDGLNIDLGEVSRASSQDLVLHRGYAPHADSDPSFLAAIAITNDNDQLPLPDCIHHTYAIAALKWTMPLQHPELHVDDSGAAAGAEGPVTILNGTPIAYRVVNDDTLNGIAHRFGITVDDLYYLNPQRSQGDSPTAYQDEILNLAQSRR